MSILRAIDRAYKLLEERKWDTIYWAIDLHDTCIVSNYKNNEFSWINEDVLKTLTLIRNLPESKIIIWSACHTPTKLAIAKFFRQHGIYFNYFNQNVEVENTTTGNFSEKFYFSILIDDKAGFNPHSDWKAIYEYLINKQNAT